MPSSMNNAKKKKEENNKMEKTGDLPKKIGETKGIFHSKMI